MRKQYILRLIKDIERFLNDDSFTLTRDELGYLVMKLEAFRTEVENTYANKKTI